MTESLPNELPRVRVKWWSEREFVFVLLIAIPTLCLRLETLPLYGEEPRRALIAREMVETGDWLVPCTQRVFLASRPPMQNWMIAIAGFAFGSIDIWASRLPSILSTIVAAAIVYGYLRQRNSPLGSMAGGIAFTTMQVVMEFGRSAETEAVFTVFVAASLLLWHWGWMNKWPAWQMWSVGYGCAALGMLTKGLQAPVYFVGSTILFLLLSGNWRAIITTGHLMGMSIFVLVFGAWQLPFTLHRGIADSKEIYFGDVAGRFVDKRWSLFFSHLVSYPCELLFVRLMPWSVLLIAYCNRLIRNKLGDRREAVLFLTLSTLFSFIFVWLPPGSKVRYFMPLFPNFAALIGIAVDCMVPAASDVAPNRIWKNFVGVHIWVMLCTSVVALVSSLILPASLISLPILGALGFAFAAIALAAMTRRSLNCPHQTPSTMRRAILFIAGFLALVQIGLITTVQGNRCINVAEQVDELRKQLPANTRLVSLGLVHHAFAFFYRQPIPIVARPPNPLPDDVEYFCLHTYENDHPELPFEWTQITVINCDRFKNQPIVKDRVFVGRVIREADVQHKKEANAIP